jgi:hypothetical protein
VARLLRFRMVMRHLVGRVGFPVLLLLVVPNHGCQDGHQVAVGTGGAPTQSGVGGVGATEEAGAGGGGALGNAGVGGGDALGQAGAGGGGASGSGGEGGFVAASYLCVAGPSRQAPGGANADGSGGGGGSPACIRGESYCFVQNFKSGAVEPSCRAFSDPDYPPNCGVTPTCDCLCEPHGRYYCQTECRCQEANGIATVTCDQI